MRKRRVISLGVITTFVVLAWLSASRLHAINPEGAVANKGDGVVGQFSASHQPLPPNRLVDINRQEVQAEELYHGRVLLVFMTTSCEPCAEQAKITSKLHDAASSKLHIYGISFERPAQLASFVKEFDLKFPMLMDVNAELIRSLDIHYFPTALLVEDGQIIKTWRGVTRDEADLYRQLGVN
jgi:peroxiredoxin